MIVSVDSGKPIAGGSSIIGTELLVLMKSDGDWWTRILLRKVEANFSLLNILMLISGCALCLTGELRKDSYSYWSGLFALEAKWFSTSGPI